MKVLRGEALAGSKALLLDVFRDSYGEKYLGDEYFLNNYILQARAALVDDSSELLSGATLIGKSARITAIATRSNRHIYGSRFQGLVSLIEASQPIDDDVWIGIGMDAHPAVKAAAEQAGMQQAINEEYVTARLKRTERLSDFSIRKANNGFEVSLKGSKHGPTYWNEVWGWQEQ